MNDNGTYIPLFWTCIFLFETYYPIDIILNIIRIHFNLELSIKWNKLYNYDSKNDKWQYNKIS